MLRFFSFVTKPLVILHIILIIQWCIFLGTILQPYTLTVPGRTYNLLRGHLIYTSLIREARDGAWKTKITHTTRPTPAIHGHTFFVFLGKIAAVFQLDPPIMYMAARMAAAVILFWSTYWFVITVLPPPLHSLALLFILALEPGPMLRGIGLNPETWRPSIFSYYPQIVSLRHFGLPHHTLGEAIGLLSLTMLILTIQKPSTKRYLLLCFFGLLGTIILPPYFIIISISVLLPWVLYCFPTSYAKKTVLGVSVLVGSITIISLFLKEQFSYGYPWKDFNQDEKRWVSNPDVLLSYVSTILLYIPFILYLWGACTLLWKKTPHPRRLLIVLMTSWTLIPALLVPLSVQHWFPIANFRLMDGYNYVPAGILATLGLHAMVSHIRHAQLAQFIYGFIISAVLLCTAYLSFRYTSLVLTEQSFPWSNVYISNDHFRAFKFLEGVPLMSGMMVSNHFGEIAPEFAPVRAFIGSTPGFIDWEERRWIVNKFYSVGFTHEEAKNLLIAEDISYVYYGDAEKSINTTESPLYPELLTPVFESPVVTVFKVNK